MKKMVIFPPVDPERLKRIRAEADKMQIVNAETQEIAETAIADATAFFGKLTPDLLARSKKLEWVQSPTASLEHYLFPALVEHPCCLTNMRGLYYDVIADHVFGYVLTFARNLHIYLRQQMQSQWEPVGGEAARSDFLSGPGQISEIDRGALHLSDCTIGIVGVGSIGAEIARRARAFGMHVLGLDPIQREIPEILPEIWPIRQLPDLLAASDFVVIAAPHTPDTEKLFSHEQFSQMRNSAYLINIGRGAIVDLAALTTALQNGEIAGAALDVFEIEPLPADHPLWGMENVLITPHVAAASPRIAERHTETLLENIRRYVRGEEFLTPADKQKWFDLFVRWNCAELSGGV